MLRFLTLFLILVLHSGCVGPTSTPLAWQDESVDLVWPSAPDRARVRYLRSLSGPDDFEKAGSSAGVLNWFLGKTQGEPALVSPYAVAASRTGIVWVADNVAHLLYRFDIKRRKIDYFQEFSGLTLVSPTGVVVDDERKRVFLTDAAHQRVFVLDDKGASLGSWAPPGGFKRPAGLALDPVGRLLVADAAAGLVFVFNPDGTLASQIHSKVNPSGLFVRPLNVAVGPNGEILVLDTFSFRVEVLDAQGELLGTIGQLGDAAGYMARPKGLAVDQEGHVFVSDSAFDNIQVFDMTGNLLMFWGRTGGSPGQFNLPAGLFVDPEGRLFVADSYNHRVQAFQLIH